MKSKSKTGSMQYIKHRHIEAYALKASFFNSLVRNIPVWEN